MPTILFHAGCSDGFCAAWAFWRTYPDAEFIPVSHGEPPPDVGGKDVIVVDFSYKRPAMMRLALATRSLVVLDHHRTAVEELDGFAAECSATMHRTPTVVFDMNKSGGRLAWEYLHGTAPSPWLVDYTEDRDLWRWALPHSQAVNAALRSYPLDFVWWTKLAEREPAELAVEGTAILRANAQVVEQHVRNATEIELAGHKVLAVNATVLPSEIAEALAKDRPFGVCWYDRGDGLRIFSLRSRGEAGIDVSEVAKSFGGGGHRNAAGFQLPAGKAVA